MTMEFPSLGRAVACVWAHGGRLHVEYAQCTRSASSTSEIWLTPTPNSGGEGMRFDAEIPSPNAVTVTLGYVAGRTLWRTRGHLDNTKLPWCFQPTGRPTLAIQREQLTVDITLPTFVVSLDTKNEDAAITQQRSTWVGVTSPALQPQPLTLSPDSVKFATELPLTKRMFVDLRVVLPCVGGAELVTVLGQVQRLTPRPTHHVALISLSFPDVATEERWEDFLCVSWMTQGMTEYLATAGI